MNGFEVLSRLRADKATAAIPVVVLTAIHKEESKTEARSMRVKDYLVKPELTVADIVERVSSHLK